MNRCGSEAVEQRIIGGMHGDQLTLQMGRELGDSQDLFATVPRRSSQ